MDIVNVHDYERLAQNKLEKSVYDYFASGAGDELTLHRNSSALSNILLIPRVLRGIRHVETQISFFGRSLTMPLFIAPSAFHCAAHPESEIATVHAANECGVGMVLSTMSTTTLEDVAISATCPLWFQLYVYKNRDITRKLIERAELAGYQCLVLTVDVPVMGHRERDIRNQFQLPKGLIAKNFLCDNLESVHSHDKGSHVKNYTDQMFDHSLSWDDIDWIQSITKLPIILKGIMHEEDAIVALEKKIAGIVISNHGGRQLDSMPAPIEVLSKISQRLKGKIPILIDGGFRRGTDIFKAIALGADCVMIGRPRTFLCTLLWGIPAWLLFFVLRDYLSAMKSARVVMIISFLVIPLNAVLNYLLMYGKLGLPNLGVAGIGYSTSIVRWLMLFALIVYIVKSEKCRLLNASIFNLKINKMRLLTMIKLGGPSGLMMGFEIGLFTLMTVFMGYFGILSLAAHQIAIQCANAVFTIPLGISQATAIQIGYAVGAKQPQSIKRIVLSANLIGLLIATCIAIIFVLFPLNLAHIFLDLREIQSISASLIITFLSMAAWLQFLDSSQVIMLGALRGMNDTFIPMIYGIFAYWMTGVSGGLFFAFVMKMQGLGLWLGLCIGVGLSTLLLVYRFFKLRTG